MYDYYFTRESIHFIGPIREVYIEGEVWECFTVYLKGGLYITLKYVQSHCLAEHERAGLTEWHISADTVGYNIEAEDYEDILRPRNFPTGTSGVSHASPERDGVRRATL